VGERTVLLLRKLSRDWCSALVFSSKFFFGDCPSRFLSLVYLFHIDYFSTYRGFELSCNYTVVQSAPMDECLDSSDYYRHRAFHEKVHRKRKAKRASDSSANLEIDSNAADLQPVIVRITQDTILRSFSPIFIDNCLKQSIGDHVSSIPLSNGDLMIKCRTAQQIRTLLSLTSWSDGERSVSISTTLLPPQGSKGVLYNVPLNLIPEEFQESLKTQNVTFTKRFKYRSRDNQTLQDSTTVLVHFSKQNYRLRLK